jgi:hypothetical protein
MPPLGQAVMASSLPVVISSNQSAVAVSVASLPLPAGAATEATLAAASAKLPASLGQKLMAASLAVVLASDQSALPVTGTFWQATQPVSIAGTVAVSGPLTDAQLRASAVPVSVASLPLPTGAATEATLAAASAKLPATLGQKAMAASMAVVLASDQSAIPVSQSGTWNIGTVSTVTNLAQMGGQPIAMGTGVRSVGTQRVTVATDDLVPISAASLPLPTGAATEATLSAMSGKLPASIGQKAMAASLAVVLASDQSAVPVTLAAGATAIGKAEDVASANADVGVPFMFTQRVVPSNLADTNGDYEIAQGYQGALWIRRPNSIGAATQITALDAVVGAPAGAGATLNGLSTAGSLVSQVCLGGESTAMVFISGGNFTGTLYWEGSNGSSNGTDGSWISLMGRRLGINETTLTNGHTAAGSSTNSMYVVPLGGYTYFRVRLVGSVLTTGPTILISLSSGNSTVVLGGSLPVGDNLIGRAKLSDGTNVAAVKAASTAAAATDPALVVALSPNNVPVSAALADASANPTTSRISSPTELFNGTTWDRARNNHYATTGDTGAKTATFNGATQTNYNARGALIVVQLGTVSGTTPTLNVQLAVSYDDGTTWITVGAASGNATASNNTIAVLVYPTNLSQAAGGTPANLTTGATQTLALNMALPRKWRLVYTIGGTTPSFAITAVHVNHLL